MLERYSSVTELLRHFYAMLNRSGMAAPTVGTDAALKVTRILAKLSEHLEQLQQQKKIMQESRLHGKYIT